MDLERFDNPARFNASGEPDPNGDFVRYEDLLAMRKILVGSLWGLGISAETCMTILRERDEIRHELHTLRDTLP